MKTNPTPTPTETVSDADIQKYITAWSHPTMHPIEYFRKLFGKPPAFDESDRCPHCHTQPDEDSSCTYCEDRKV